MKSRSFRFLLTWMAFAGCLAGLLPATAQTTNVVNDGTTTANLTLIANKFGTGGASLSLTPEGGELLAEQTDQISDFPLNGVWYAKNVAAATNVYAVLADVRPIEGFPEYLTGVMGWLDTETARGIAFRISPGTTLGAFQVSSLHFDAETAEQNDSTTNLFNLDGTAADFNYGSASGQVGDYDPAVAASVMLQFTAPTAADLAAVPNATSHVTARVYQKGAQVGDTVEILTTQTLPATPRVGYYGCWGTSLAPGGSIGYLKSLRVVGDIKIVNQPPTVELTSPLDGATFDAPTDVNLVAVPQDPEGQVARVDFFQGATPVGSASASPYTATVTGLGVGKYTFTAKAVDKDGASGTSLPVTIEVVNKPPTVSIVSPANNSTFPAPASVKLEAEAQDIGGSIAKVEFYQGASLVGTATTTPYTVTVNDLPLGAYTFTAKAVDNLGASSTSAPVRVEVVNQPPTVSITSPKNGASFTAPANVTLLAEANDVGGQIQRVDFFQGGNQVGSVTAAPYSVTVSNLAVGSYTFTAKAVDNSGVSATSDPVTVEVSSVALPPVVADPVALPAGGPMQEFQFTGKGLSGSTYRVESTTNFTSWTTVESGTITSATKVFKYPRSTTSNHLYYRLVVTGSGGGGSVTPAVLGGSKPLPSSSDFKEFVFTATEVTGRSYRVESTSDFKAWATVTTGSVTGATMEFRFPRSAGTNNLYYRLVSLP